MHAFKKDKKSGLTLIEILVATTILLTMIGVGTASYNTFNEKQKQRQTLLTLKNNIVFARTKATSAERLSGCNKLLGYFISYVDARHYKMNYRCVGALGAVTEPELNSYTTPDGVALSAFGAIFFNSIGQNAVITNDSSAIVDSIDIEISNPANADVYYLTIDKSGDIAGPNKR